MHVVNSSFTFTSKTHLADLIKQVIPNLRLEIFTSFTSLVSKFEFSQLVVGSGEQDASTNPTSTNPEFIYFFVKCK